MLRDRRNWSHRICAVAGELRTPLEQSADDPLKTGFRAKDAKNAKKLLQGELVEFVYESFDVTFEERAINHRCSGRFSSIRGIFAFFASLARIDFQKSQHQTRSYRYAKFNGNFVLVALRGHAPVRIGVHIKGCRPVSFTNSDGEQLEPFMTIQGCLYFSGVCCAGLEQKHRGGRSHSASCGSSRFRTVTARSHGKKEPRIFTDFHGCGRP